MDPAIAIDTGVDSFIDPARLGVLYPFSGFEVVFVAIGVALWLLWHVSQTRVENRTYRDALDLYRRVGMRRAMHFSSRSRIGTDEDIEKVKKEAELVASEPVTPGKKDDSGDLLTHVQRIPGEEPDEGTNIVRQ